MAHYLEYYENQVGGGAVSRYSRFGRVYVGAPYQQGHGIGAFLGGLFRQIMPIFGRAAKAVGKEALSAGMNVVGDVASRQIPLRESLENRLTESGLRLKRKATEKLDQIMRGSGYKKRRITRKIQKGGRLRRVRSAASKVHKKKRTSRKKKRVKKKTVKKSSKHNKKKKSRDVYDIFH